MTIAEKANNQTAAAVTAEPERLDLRSHDIEADKEAELLRLFPEIRTEGGKIDFDRLKLALGQTVDVGKERYGMNWPGKADCFRTIQAPSVGTLRPCAEESVNFDTTENLIIEGDNLEVLKLLQKSYLGKIKMIYIDPPYNTGNDFIYPDNFSESLETYLEYTRQVDAEGKKFGTNTEADGRFHSKWLNMMYPRLYLARNLLSSDGMIAVSIDDAECHNLRLLMNDVFGEECFVAQIAVVNNLKGRNDRKHIATAHEYVLLYANPDFVSNGMPLSEKQLAEYRQKTKDGEAFQWRDLRKRGGADTRSERPNLYFPVYADPKTGKVALEKSDQFSMEIFPRKSDGTDGCWRWGHSTVSKNLVELQAFKVESKDKWNVSYRVYLEKDGELRAAKPKSVWMGPEFSTDAATKTLRALIPGIEDLTPKPVALVALLAQMSLDDEDIVLDFFAGSGTTAQAVLEINKSSGGNRRFILVQLPEPTSLTDFPTIAEITKERVRRVIKKLDDEDSGKLGLNGDDSQDRGFRVYKLAESNFTTWDPSLSHDPKALEQQLELHVDHVRENRSGDDILYELLLKSGFLLTTAVEKKELAGKTIYSVAGGALVICLERALTLELIRAIAGMKPERVVCLDEGFARNDQLKANAVQTFKTKGVTSFKTV
jgi:adenine-specific DNA-methyltransferase